jgi:hypothetical protein
LRVGASEPTLARVLRPYDGRELLVTDWHGLGADFGWGEMVHRWSTDGARMGHGWGMDGKGLFDGVRAGALSHGMTPG